MTNNYDKAQNTTNYLVLQYDYNILKVFECWTRNIAINCDDMYKLVHEEQFIKYDKVQL